MSALLASAVLLSALAVVAGALSPARLRAPLTAAIGLASLALWSAASLGVLGGGAPATLRWSAVVPFGGLAWRLDAAAALVGLVGSLVAASSLLYWTGYARHGLRSRTGAAALAAFTFSVVTLPAAATVVTFAWTWELMALASLTLVLTEHRRAEVRSAGRWYAALTQGGAALILLALVLLAAHAHSGDLATITRAARHLPGATRAAVLVLGGVGFLAKAGAVPWHVWLPKAHAEAPAPVSPVMSGAMVNLGLVGALLLALRWAAPAPGWWWAAVAVVGALSALYGALQAATRSDLKVLLAYSTTENVGLVLVAVGTAGLLGTGPAQRALLVAALALMVSHSLFKGTLFLAAGSIQRATGTRDLDQLGGLARRMPVTASAALVAVAAVCALPPSAGFAAEWALLEGLARGGHQAGTVGVVSAVGATAVVALAGGLALVAFVKAAGIGLLGRARSTGAAEAHEVTMPQRLAPAVLAAASLLLGLAAPVLWPFLQRAAASFAPSAGLAPHWRAASLVGLRAATVPALWALWLVAALVVVLVWRTRAGRAAEGRRLRRAEPWGSGRVSQSPRMQYTATSFAEPLQRVFDDVVRPESDLAVTPAAEARYYVSSIRWRTSHEDLVERLLYRPALGLLDRVGRAARALHSGSVHRYLAFGLGAVVVLLVVVR